MVLSSEEARVLACLFDKQLSDPDDDPMTLDALRLACNRTGARDVAVAYDDRTVDAALLSLKSMGLVRFVDPSDGGRAVRYRHTADERWRLDAPELAALAMLVLGGPQTPSELRARALGAHGDGATIDDALDTLASRRPEPFALRLEPRRGEQEIRFAHLLTGDVEEPGQRAPRDGNGSDRSGDETPSELASLTAEVAFLRARVVRLEHELGLSADEDDPDRDRPGHH